MASDFSFVQYVLEQAREAGEITYKKMFGEYGIYCDGKIIGVVCDNIFYVKKTEAGAEIFPDLEEAPPYQGAKPHFVVDALDDKERLTKFIRVSCDELPAPKPKKKI